MQEKCIDEAMFIKLRRHETETSNTSTTSTPEVRKTDLEAFSKKFEGAINNQHQITMNLERNGESLLGSYTYTKYNIPISIKGTIDGQGNVVINEFENKGDQTGVFKGRMVSDREIEGGWSKPTGDKSAPFSLREIGDGSEVASSQSNSNSSQTTRKDSGNDVTAEEVVDASEAYRRQAEKEVKNIWSKIHAKWILLANSKVRHFNHFSATERSQAA